MELLKTVSPPKYRFLCDLPDECDDGRGLASCTTQWSRCKSSEQRKMGTVIRAAELQEVSEWVSYFDVRFPSYPSISNSIY